MGGEASPDNSSPAFLETLCKSSFLLISYFYTKSVSQLLEITTSCLNLRDVCIFELFALFCKESSITSQKVAKYRVSESKRLPVE